MEHNHPKTGRFPLAMQQRMKELGLSLRDIARQTDTTYEHVRRIIKGDYFPSKYVLKGLCEVLKFNYAEASKIVNADRLAVKFGSEAVSEIMGRNSELAPIERTWASLSEEQKRELIDKANSMSESNARTETASSSAGRQADTNAV